MSTEAILMKYHSPTQSKAPSCFSGKCSRLDGQRISENPRVIRCSLTMMLCKPLSNLLWSGYKIVIRSPGLGVVVRKV